MVATFKKADLHLHLPGTGQGYHCDGQMNLNTDRERRAFAEDFVRHVREKAHLDIIAVTCHNDVSWVEPIHKAAQRLYGDALTVFPGIEIGTHSGSDGVHVLALFEVSTSRERMEEFRLAVGLRSDQCFDDAGAPRCTNLSFPQVLEKISEFQGIAIAPHVFSENGLLSSERQAIRVEDFTNPLLWAVDFKSTMDDLDPRGRAVLQNCDPNPNYRRKQPIACLNSSDARCLANIGTWYTWIKCETVNLESLRQALLDHEARLRLRDEPPPEPRYVIERLQVTHTQSGFLRGLKLEFSEYLNCLIGGRGVGKSAIIELLRYLWEQEPMKKQRTEFERFVHVFFPPTASVTLELTSREHAIPVRYRFQREGDQTTQVHRQESDGSYSLRPDLRPGGVCTLDIYGQKEVLFTAEDFRAQLDLLDKLIGAGMASLQEEEEDLLAQLDHNRETLVARRREMARYQERVGRLPEVAERLESYRLAGLGEKAGLKQQYDREAQLWQVAWSQMEAVASALEETQQEAKLDLSYLADEHLQSLPNQADLKQLRKFLKTFTQEIHTGLKGQQEAVTRIQAALKRLRDDWQVKFDVFDTGYRKLLTTLGAQPDFDPDEVLRLEREKSQLEGLQREVKRLRGEIQRLVEARQSLLRRLVANRHQQYELRQDKASDIFGRLSPRVRVTIAEGGDKEALQQSLKIRLTGSRLREPDYQAVAEDVGGHLLRFLADLEAADTGLDDSMRLYASLSDLWPAHKVSTTLNLFDEDPVARFAQFYRLDRDKASKFVDFLDWESRLELDTYRVPDLVTIELNIAREEDVPPIWQPLDRLSVGQKCTAVLSIILLASPYPLIVDQPEDDLDNRFIYDEVVQILRRERGGRQIVIATHNANIPVAGDAEQIFALDTVEETLPGGRKDLRCQVVISGFINRPEVRQQVSTILEGGEQAFALRRQKYGF